MRIDIKLSRRKRLRERHLAAPLAMLLNALADGDALAATAAAEWLAEKTAEYEAAMEKLNYRGMEGRQP